MVEKVLMSERASRVLVDWTIAIGCDSLSGTWAFDRHKWIRWEAAKRIRKLQKAARDEIRRFASDNWERFTKDDVERLILAARLRLVPRRTITWELAPTYWPWSACDY